MNVGSLIHCLALFQSIISQVRCMATSAWGEASSRCHQSRWHLWRFTTSPYCCSFYTRGFLKWQKNQRFLSFCFLLSASPPCSSTHSKSQWHWLFLCCCIVFLCTALLASGLHGSPQHCLSSPWILFLWFWVFTDPSKGQGRCYQWCWKFLC